MIKHWFLHTIGPGDTAPDRALRFDALNHLLQAAALDHSTRISRGYDYLHSIGAMWVLHRIGVITERPLLVGEQLKIATWVTSFKSVRAYREFELMVEGQVVARAQSIWVFFDAERRMPRRFPPELVAAFPVTPPPVEVQELVPPAGNCDGSSCFVQLNEGDFDANAHVNNARYLRFAVEALAALHPLFTPLSYTVSYLHEIPRGETQVEVECQVQADQVFCSIRAAGVDRARVALSSRPTLR